MAETDLAAEERVLLLAPTARDAALSRSLLAEAGLTCAAVADLAALCRALESGAGAVILPEEVAVSSEIGLLIAALERQPPWSDLPVIVLTAGRADSALAVQALHLLGNVTLLELPVRVPTLVSAVQAALRARRRQYQVREHLAERKRSEAALQAIDQRKDEFLALLAHELRNPLGAVSNALEVLRRADPDHPAWRRAMQVVERQVHHQARLVDDLLEVSRITRGKIHLRPERLDLTPLVREISEDHRPALEAAGLTLLLELPEERVWVEADPTRLAQVVGNLLSNAMKFTPAGGRVTVGCRVSGVGYRVPTSDPTPDTRHPTPSAAVLVVRDTGVGIEPEMLLRVFDAFTQADRTLHRSPGGLGLGLALAKGLVELHGGEIDAASDGIGRGAEFSVRLPLAPAPGASRETPAPASAARAAVRVLVVEDNRDAAESLRDLLALCGYRVEVVYSGPAGVAAARGFRPDVVLCDIGLPGMDGYAVAAALGKDPMTASARLLAVSGYGQEEDQHRARAAGFDQHLTKPIDLEQLQQLLTVRSEETR